MGYILSQPTLSREGEAKQNGAPSHGENAWSRHQHLFEENIRKTRNDEGLRILKMRVWELFTHGEGISTPHARHKGWQPLIECAKHDFKICIFPFYVYYFFGVNKGVALAPTYPQV